MSEMSVGRLTDLEILSLSGSIFEVCEDYIVVSTPDNPTYHWGNFIQILKPFDTHSAEYWFSLFSSEFPSADWVAIGLASKPKDASEWGKLGLKVEEFEVMATGNQPGQTQPPAGFVVRELAAEDFDLLSCLEISENEDEGLHEPVSYEAFVHATNQTRAKFCESGQAAWFGAFHGDELVSSLGIVLCGDVARYQSVQTRKGFRKLGLASHLLGVAGEWARSRGAQSWVIVTETRSEAGRVYGRAGFVPVESIFDVSLK